MDTYAHQGSTDHGRPSQVGGKGKRRENESRPVHPVVGATQDQTQTVRRHIGKIGLLPELVYKVSGISDWHLATSAKVSILESLLHKLLYNFLLVLHSVPVHHSKPL
jgi:hypothetical protein